MKKDFGEKKIVENIKYSTKTDRLITYMAVNELGP